MKPIPKILMVALIFGAVSSSPGLAQRGCPVASTSGSVPGVTNTLYGELQVLDIPNAISQSFRITLKHLLGGHVHGEATVGVGGRFQFFEVPNDDYQLVVEKDLKVIYEEQFMVSAPASSPIRKDLSFMWRTLDSTPRNELVYARRATDQKRYEEALQASAQGKLDKASKQFSQIVEKDPADYQAWTELGTVESRRGRLGKAEAAYLEATKVAPDYLLAWLNLGKVRVNSENWDGATEALERALRLDEERAETHYLMGECLLQKRQGSMAVQHLEEALRLAPFQMADAHLRLAALYNAAGLKSRAAKEYKLFLEKVPDFPQKEELLAYIAESGDNS